MYALKRIKAQNTESKHRHRHIIVKYLILLKHSQGILPQQQLGSDSLLLVLPPCLWWCLLYGWVSLHLVKPSPSHVAELHAYGELHFLSKKNHKMVFHPNSCLAKLFAFDGRRTHPNLAVACGPVVVLWTRKRKWFYVWYYVCRYVASWPRSHVIRH